MSRSQTTRDREHLFVDMFHRLISEKNMVLFARYCFTAVALSKMTKSFCELSTTHRSSLTRCAIFWFLDLTRWKWNCKSCSHASGGAQKDVPKGKQWRRSNWTDESDWLQIRRDAFLPQGEFCQIKYMVGQTMWDNLVVTLWLCKALTPSTSNLLIWRL